jgi:hypothetical protein
LLNLIDGAFSSRGYRNFTHRFWVTILVFEQTPEEATRRKPSDAYASESDE